jgi:hypothetical protein
MAFIIIDCTWHYLHGDRRLYVVIFSAQWGWKLRVKLTEELPIRLSLVYLVGEIFL